MQEDDGDDGTSASDWDWEPDAGLSRQATLRRFVDIHDLTSHASEDGDDDDVSMESVAPNAVAIVEVAQPLKRRYVPPDPSPTFDVVLVIALTIGAVAGSFLYLLVAEDRSVLVAVSPSFAVLPALVLFYVLYWRKNREELPLYLAIRYVLYGIYTLIPVVFLEFPLLAAAVAIFLPSSDDRNTDDPQDHMTAIILYAVFCGVLVAALIEETLRFFLAAQIVRREAPRPAMVRLLCLLAGLGFGAIENVGIVMSLALSGADEDDIVFTVGLRAFFSVPLHCALAAMQGASMGKARYHGRRANLIRVAGVPFLLHGLFDVVAFFVVGWFHFEGADPWPNYLLGACVLIAAVTYLVAIRHGVLVNQLPLFAKPWSPSIYCCCTAEECLGEPPPPASRAGPEAGTAVVMRPAQSNKRSRRYRSVGRSARQARRISDAGGPREPLERRESAHMFTDTLLRSSHNLPVKRKSVIGVFHQPSTPSMTAGVDVDAPIDAEAAQASLAEAAQPSSAAVAQVPPTAAVQAPPTHSPPLLPPLPPMDPSWSHNNVVSPLFAQPATPPIAEPQSPSVNTRDTPTQPDPSPSLAPRVPDSVTVVIDTRAAMEESSSEVVDMTPSSSRGVAWAPLPHPTSDPSMAMAMAQQDSQLLALGVPLLRIIACHMELTSLAAFAMVCRQCAKVVSSGTVWTHRLRLDAVVVLSADLHHAALPHIGTPSGAYRSLCDANYVGVRAPLSLAAFESLRDVFVSGLLCFDGDQQDMALVPELAMMLGRCCQGNLSDAEVTMNTANVLLPPGHRTEAKLTEVKRRWAVEDAVWAEESNETGDVMPPLPRRQFLFAALAFCLPNFGAQSFMVHMVDSVGAYMRLKLGRRFSFNERFVVGRWAVVLLDAQQGSVLQVYSLTRIARYAAVRRTKCVVLETPRGVLQLACEDPQPIVHAIDQSVQALIAAKQ